jgi:transcription antitermination factor NusG
MAWYVIYTKSRQEKKVAESLNILGIEAYCPIVSVMKQWSDRKKKVSVPLINSYVFVNIEDCNRDEVFKVPGIVRYLFWLGKPAVVRDVEIETLRVSLEGVVASFEIEEIRKDSHVTLEEGPFKGAEGIVKHLNKNSMQLLLVDLGFLVTINR